MSRIVILGLHTLEVKNLPSIAQRGDEFWAMNDFFNFYPSAIKPALCFNIHKQIMREGWTTSANLESDCLQFNYHDEYAKFPSMGVVVMERVPQLTNMQYIFNAKDYTTLFHMNETKIKSTLCSTPADMLALACARCQKDVYLHACNMKHKYFDFTDNTMKGEAITQTIPLIWFVDYLRKNHGMRIVWPAESALRKEYGNQALFWQPTEVNMMYGEHVNTMEIKVVTWKQRMAT